MIKFLLRLSSNRIYHLLLDLIFISSVIWGGIGTYLFLWDRAHPNIEVNEITAQVTTGDELTQFATLPGLEGRFTYEGQDVSHLWKVTANFVNTGNRDVIGTGEQKTIFDDGIYFYFPAGTQIVGVSPVTVDKLGDVGMSVSLPNRFHISFNQLRPKESILATFYIASEKPLDDAPLPQAESPYDSIVNGFVCVQDCRLTQHNHAVITITAQG